MDIFIQGLEVYGHHGVAHEEKVLGQRLLFDVRLTIEECRAAQTDDVADTVDYTEVLDLIVEVATTEQFLPPRATGAGHGRGDPQQVPRRRSVGAGHQASSAGGLRAGECGRCRGTAARRHRGLRAGRRRGRPDPGLPRARLQPRGERGDASPGPGKSGGVARHPVVGRLGVVPHGAGGWASNSPTTSTRWWNCAPAFLRADCWRRSSG